jgi:3-hydroxybutyryl-CoA dehydrogenase
MKIVVTGNELSFIELTQNHAPIEWVRAKDGNSFIEYEDADAFFNLNENAYQLNYSNINKPVFINSVVHTLGNNKNVIRINGWHGFLEKDTWELSGPINSAVEKALLALNKKWILTADEPGFISARIIAMIINEAYFAKEEKLSSENEIDIAMKLGTNYPYGPFEWAEKIGLKNIYDLLVQLSVHDKRYLPSTSMINLIYEL